MSIRIAAALVIALSLVPAVSAAQGGDDDEGGRSLEFHAILKNVYLYRNDSDFDPSPPKYGPDGQTEGVIGTNLRSFLTWHVSNKLKIHYEVELGLNVWSKNNPDQIDATAGDVFLMKHREVYAEGLLADDLFWFKVGYQHYEDPTALFIGHWFGAANAGLNLEWGKLVATAGVLPDKTYEGISVTQNNFTHDISLFALRGEFPIGKRLVLQGGLFTLHDASTIRKTMTLWTPAFSLRAFHDTGRLSMSLIADLAMQFGPSRHVSYDGGDQMNHGWAGQIHGGLAWRHLHVDVNFLVLSPDDPYDNDGSNGAFYYSGKSRSSAMLLAEDKINDWYDNIDERTAVRRGAFFLTRPGYLLADVKASYAYGKYFRPAVIIGAAWVLQPKNALDENFVGTEADLDLRFDIANDLEFHLMGGMLVPGGAAAALINAMDRTAADTIYTVESALIVKF